MTDTYYERLEAAGHVLQKDEDGEVDAFGWSVEGHNGPRCAICDDHWCEHCATEPNPCDGGVRKRAYDAKKRLEASAPALLEALEEARTTISILRTQVMVEIGRCPSPEDSRWEGVPDKLKDRLDEADRAIVLATGEGV